MAVWRLYQPPNAVQKTLEHFFYNSCNEIKAFGSSGVCRHHQTKGGGSLTWTGPSPYHIPPNTPEHPPLRMRCSRLHTSAQFSTWHRRLRRYKNQMDLFDIWRPCPRKNWDKAVGLKRTVYWTWATYIIIYHYLVLSSVTIYLFLFGQATQEGRGILYNPRTIPSNWQWQWR